jgi:hypothetical protein
MNTTVRCLVSGGGVVVVDVVVVDSAIINQHKIKDEETKLILSSIFLNFPMPYMLLITYSNDV